MKHSIARVISTVFQPLLMPTYGVMLLFVYTYFGDVCHRFWLIVAPSSFLVLSRYSYAYFTAWGWYGLS